MTYYTSGGDIVSKAQIELALKSGLARLVHGYGDGCIRTALSLDGVDIDTRGDCYSVWDEAWTQIPVSLQEACRNAK